MRDDLIPLIPYGRYEMVSRDHHVISLIGSCNGSQCKDGERIFGEELL